MAGKHGILVADALQHLAIRGIFAWANPTGAVRSENGAWIKYGKLGSGDILGCLPDGRHWEGEAKVRYSEKKVDSQKQNQKIHQMMIEKNNGIYIIFETAESLMRSLDSYLA